MRTTYVCKTNSQTKVGLVLDYEHGGRAMTMRRPPQPRKDGWVGMRCTDQMYVWMDHGLSWLELASAGI